MSKTGHPALDQHRLQKPGENASFKALGASLKAKVAAQVDGGDQAGVLHEPGRLDQDEPLLAELEGELQGCLAPGGPLLGPGLGVVGRGQEQVGKRGLGPQFLQLGHRGGTPGGDPLAFELADQLVSHPIVAHHQGGSVPAWGEASDRLGQVDQLHQIAGRYRFVAGQGAGARPLAKTETIS